MTNAPVLLVGDIDRGGVFAQLYGTAALLEPDERDRIKGLIINKFRGDLAILGSGISRIEELTGIKCVGVVPYSHADIDDEDSLSERFDSQEKKDIDIAVIRLPRISNFTDFMTFERFAGVSVRYVDKTSQLRNPDIIIIPGTKSTIHDMLWMRQNGLEAAVKNTHQQEVLHSEYAEAFRYLAIQYLMSAVQRTADVRQYQEWNLSLSTRYLQ